MTLKSIQEYGKGFQIKVLSSLLTHKEFLTNIYDILNEEDFNNQAHRWIVKEILSYYNKYHTTPSLDILKVELQKVDNEVLSKIYDNYSKLIPLIGKVVVGESEPYEYLIESIKKFVNQEELVSLMNKNNF